LDTALRAAALRIILIGFGTVAQSLVRILIKEKSWFAEKHGFEPQVTAIADSQGSCRDDEGLDLSLALITKKKHGTVQKYPGKGRRRTNSEQLISETEGEVMIETTPSNFKDGEPGLSNVNQAFMAGKHVITTNKGPLALAMPMLLELASHRKLQLLFSGTVGGGTPLLSFASKSLLGEKITGVRGILNGTSNYILTRMEEASLSFREALKEAQKKGYAESNPANDIDGLDTAAKIVIISNWILKRRLKLGDIKVTGISKIEPSTIKKARSTGSRIKLIGRLTESEAYVRPEEVRLEDPICVRETLNALTFTTEHVGDMTVIGHGAGGEQTASAIIRDLVDVRNRYSI
jgi:homoserine dehydrogenase